MKEFGQKEFTSGDMLDKYKDEIITINGERWKVIGAENSTNKNIYLHCMDRQGIADASKIMPLDEFLKIVEDQKKPNISKAA
jgi:hypothetical protein